MRALALQKIDSEIEQILTLNHSQQEQYSDFARELTAIEHHYRSENVALREEIASLTERCEEWERLYLATKDDLIANVALLEQMECAKLASEKQVVRLKLMVRNQEGLFDDYKKNLVEEMEL
jgi:predicted  nucleic acid-binding Zn-ribbon protein